MHLFCPGNTVTEEQHVSMNLNDDLLHGENQ